MPVSYLFDLVVLEGLGELGPEPPDVLPPAPLTVWLFLDHLLIVKMKEKRREISRGTVSNFLNGNSSNYMQSFRHATRGDYQFRINTKKHESP